MPNLELELNGHIGPITCAAVSPDSKLIATGGDDCTIKLWRAGTTQIVSTLPKEECPIERVQFSRDSKLLVTGGSQHVDPAALDVKSSGGDENEEARVRLTIKVWQLDNKGTWAAPTLLHTVCMLAKICCRDLQISPDNSKLAFSRSGEPLVLWNLKTGKHVLASPCAEDGVFEVTWAPDSKVVACGSDAGVVMWDSGSGKQVGEDMGQEHGIVSCLAFANKASLLVTGTFDALVVLYELPESGKKGRKKAPQAHKLAGHEKAIITILFSPNDTCVVSWCQDKSVRVWDVASRRQMRLMKDVHCGVSGVVWCSRGDDIKFLVANAESSVGLYSAAKVRDCVCLHAYVRLHNVGDVRALIYTRTYVHARTHIFTSIQACVHTWIHLTHCSYGCRDV
jgi:WD40 repeat protein